jgi:thymidylate synthase (FAD)
MTKLLNHGEVVLMDHMGNDGAIVQAARVSYDKDSTNITRSDAGLINYLMRHNHTSPFEMVEFKFYLKMPIFVARQWIRHRTANLNEYSGRYSVMKDEFHIFEEFNYQSLANKQGSGMDIVEGYTGEVEAHSADAFRLYNRMIEDGVSREQARCHLPLSTYTELVWKIDLHNLFHFLKLRKDSHAQKEIRLYADAIADLIQPIVPLAYRAFENYKLNAYTLSHAERVVLTRLLSKLDEDQQNTLVTEFKTMGTTPREIDEFFKAMSSAY